MKPKKTQTPKKDSALRVHRFFTEAFPQVKVAGLRDLSLGLSAAKITSAPIAEESNPPEEPTNQELTIESIIKGSLGI